MEINASGNDLSNLQSENNSSVSKKSHDQHLVNERMENISQALWKAIHSADENDASLWRMWR